MAGRPACFALLLASGFLGALAANYGVARSPAECKTHHDQNDAKYLSGELEPHFATGPPDECGTQGCQDAYWGPRSRNRVEPTCPRELVLQLTAQLRERASQGAQWATDALLLQPCDMWQHMRGHTTWVVGDSVTEAIGTSLSSFMIEYWDKDNWEVTLSTDEHVKAGLDIGAMEGVKGGGKRIPYWCFEMGTPTDRGRLCYLKGDRLKRSLHVLNILPSISQPNDVVIINIGTHYNDMENLSEDMSILGYALGNPLLPKYRIWLETPPQHYETATGMFNISRPIHEQMCFPGGHAQGTNLTTYPDGSVGILDGAPRPHPGSEDDVALQRLLAGGERNLATQPIVDNAGIVTLRTWNTSLPIHQFHTHSHLPGEGECSVVQCDCTHSCFPSTPQVAMAALPRILSHMRAHQRTTELSRRQLH